MMVVSSQHQDIIQLSHRKSNYPIATKFISQFSSWAKFWLSTNEKTNHQKRKKIDSVDKDVEDISISQRAHLYQLTCNKLQPSHHSKKALGDVLHIRKFWQELETAIYQHEISFVPSTKRIPFDPDIPGSVYLPKKSRKKMTAHKKVRESYALSHMAHTFKQDINLIETKSLISQKDDDDDNVPLGILRFSKKSPFFCK
ncbi:unnamed protein product [Rhizopus stolonifer]